MLLSITGNVGKFKSNGFCLTTTIAVAPVTATTCSTEKERSEKEKDKPKKKKKGEMMMRRTRLEREREKKRGETQKNMRERNKSSYRAMRATDHIKWKLLLDLTSRMVESQTVQMTLHIR